MTPEQIALAQLSLAHLQLWITAAAIFLGPITGVIFTFWFQARKDKSFEKHKLFLALMSERKSPVVSWQRAQALNTIDVVFSRNKEIVALWHKYYSLLSQLPNEDRAHTWLQLLKAMANELGYPSVEQTDLDKFYTPQSHVDDWESQKNMAEQWMRVLKNTERFIIEPVNSLQKVRSDGVEHVVPKA